MRIKNQQSRLKLIPSEHIEQTKLVNWLRFKGILFCSIPNGANKSFGQRQKFKAEGLVAGAPDLLIFDFPKIDIEDWVEKFNQGKSLPIDRFGVAVEMKRQKGGVQSPEQKQWQNDLEARGWVYILGKGYEDAKRQLEELGF